MSQVEKVLKIQPGRFVHFYTILFLWNSYEPSTDMKITKIQNIINRIYNLKDFFQNNCLSLYSGVGLNHVFYIFLFNYSYMQTYV